MIGLEYILNLYSMTGTELAEDLKIKKQNISRWFKGVRKIPVKYLDILEDKFKIPKEYIIKNVRGSDKLIIQKYKIENENKKVLVQNKHNSLIGLKEFIPKEEEYEPKVQKELDTLDYDIERYKLLEKIEDIIFAKNRDKHPYYSDDSALSLYQSLTDIYLNKKVNILILFEIFEAIGLSNIKDNKELARILFYKIEKLIPDIVFALKRNKLDEEKGFTVYLQDDNDIDDYNDLVNHYKEVEEEFLKRNKLK
ncbi:helix-turn-helix domain-containing protein [Clostridium tyrobutyricum]|uniref:helix-turn-helix domain-containing protein n=1 Tax=Clostridium tyrobutyricum TaxID=1519 RepID=UPI0010AA763C|nr:helix-turn-helix transcriptional regulator [Clostridium tyrobutyricum]QCH27619.1 hypothetical protein EZN00_01217 [Clostridium tyrobutyricum]